jgi:hypothetical protein
MISEPDFVIEMRSINMALEHLGMVDLDELAAACQIHGTAEDCRKIELARQLITPLPQTLGPLH